MCRSHNSEIYSCRALNAYVRSGHLIKNVARESAAMTAHLTSSVSTGASSTRYFMSTLDFQTHAMWTTSGSRCRGFRCEFSHNYFGASLEI